ncbi:MAG TPA: AMP-binding protein [Acidimicrobiales bacterium]|nr:AMP-binding protein [Acidimicrobiales bacterium]
MTESYASGVSEHPLLGVTLGAALSERAADQPDDLALISRHQGIRLTWHQLDEQARSVARGLMAAGIEPGDRVGIWSPSAAQWTLLQFGSAMAGAILVNINPSYRAAELQYALAKVGVRLLVTAAGFRDADYLGMIAEVRPDCPHLEMVVCLDPQVGAKADATWDDLVRTGWAPDGVRSGTPEAWDAELDVRMEVIDPDDPVNIQFTSGTTGQPKGATLSHHNIVNNADVIAGVLGYGPGDKVCIPVPLYHCFGMGIGNLGCLLSGSTIVYPADSFDPGATLEAISEEGCTSIYGVPTMFIAMLEHPDFGSFDLASLRTGVMAGAPCPIELMRRVVAEMHAEEMTICYGMTETSPVSTMTRRDDDLIRRTSSVGRPLPHTEIKLVDPETGRIVPRGQPGELCSRGYLVMSGYWDDADATRRSVRHGWMHTGDLAVMDEDGYLNIVGRLTDMVIRGGENIYPREVEEVLFEHPGVASVQVVGVPDARMGEELAAFVVVRAGASVDEDEIRQFCRARLARFKVPRHVCFTDEFPMTVTGKVQKFRLRDQAIERLGLQAAAGIETA